MSLFPAYATTSTTNSDYKQIPINSGHIETKADDGQQQQPNWLSLKSFDDKRVVELNKEIVVSDDVVIGGQTKNDERNRHRKHKSSKRDDSSKLRSAKERHESSLSVKKWSKGSSNSLAQQLSDKTFIEETGLSLENAYRFDTKGDKNNLAFDSLYYKKCANYEKKRTIDTTRLRHRNNDSNIRHKSKKMRYYSQENRSLLKKNLKDTIDLSKAINPILEPLEFIAVTENQAYRQISNVQSNPLGVYDVKTALWSEGKGSLDDIPLPETTIKFQSMNDTNTDKKVSIGPNSCPNQEQYIYDKTQEFNSYLKNNETDVKKWLEFIAFQDKSVDISVDISTNSDKIEGKSVDIYIAEKKLIICEKALSFNPKSIDLLLCRLEIAADIWDFDKLVKEWKHLAFVYPNSMQMWRKYLCFTHQNITHFKASKTIKVYEKCIQMLSKMSEKTFISHKPPENLEQEMVSILSSYCRFLLHLGQTERAVSTFQALIEFNLFTPSLLTYDMSLQDWKTLFEPFWDSGCPRFGENEAIGWSQVLTLKNVVNNQTKNNDIQNLIDEEENKIINENNKSVIWIKFELLRQKFHWLPARNDSDVDDPERIVCSDDIIDMLVRFREQQSKYLLVKMFLQFLLSIDSKTSENVIKNDVYIELPIDISNFAIELPLLPNFFGSEAIIQSILKSSVVLFNGQYKCDLVLLWIEYEMNKSDNKLSAKQMRKFLKDFLKDDVFRNDLNIWSHYVSFEYSLADNKSEPRKLFHTAIEFMIKSNQNSEQLFRFVRKYIELELNITCLSKMSSNLSKDIIKYDSVCEEFCLNSLLSISCGQMLSKSTPTIILKAINSLRLITNPSHNHLFCLIYIYYFTKGVQQTIDVIEETLVVKQTVINDKHLYNIYLQLLLLNIRQNFGQSLKQLRSVLNRALGLYSTDPQFLGLFVNIEFMSNVFCRMRRFFNKTYQLVRNEGNRVENWYLIVYAIHSELKRLNLNNETYTGYDTKSGIINRVRLLFQRAISSHQLNNSVILWRLYIKFELMCNNTLKAKALLYRALQTCSYSKILYMDGIQYFGSQLQELVDIMTEKELRIRSPLEEIDLLMNSLN
ncbi:nuclear exosome regulator NRDE2-like [Oppia nitens]|uniref:nuclear exosome regulator NRDE2-like n=1 Tax=Oppia nitens TaxID=1686743 RepID=UPI0023DB1ECA|nr:nuclear exosome regulator NRDE2-like [Oppia nitens]